jgi:hypothetical protein
MRLKSLSFLVLSIFLPLKLEATIQYYVELKPGSFLKIHGLTNINNFDLLYHINNTLVLRPSVNVSDSCYSITNANNQIPLKYFETDNTQLKSDFLDLVKEKQFPNMILSLNCFYFTKNISDNSIKRGIAEVAITLAGVTRFYSIQFITNKDKSNNTYHLEGHQTLNIRDFKLEPPKKFFGLIQVKEMIEIDFNLKMYIISKS